MPFTSAVFGIQLKMGVMFLCQEQLHSFYFYSFNNFSSCAFALYHYGLEGVPWQALQPCACWYLPGILILVLLSCGLQYLFQGPPGLLFQTAEPEVLVPSSYKCKEVLLCQYWMSLLSFHIQVKLAVFVFITSKQKPFGFCLVLFCLLSDSSFIYPCQPLPPFNQFSLCSRTFLGCFSAYCFYHICKSFPPFCIHFFSHIVCMAKIVNHSLYEIEIWIWPLKLMRLPLAYTLSA